MFCAYKKWTYKGFETIFVYFMGYCVFSVSRRVGCSLCGFAFPLKFVLILLSLSEEHNHRVQVDVSRRVQGDRVVDFLLV